MKIIYLERRFASNGSGSFASAQLHLSRRARSCITPVIPKNGGPVGILE